MRQLFNDSKLYDLAMTHCGNIGVDNNQRLEFLGDRVLGIIVADMLYAHFPHANEGELARRHAALVCGETIANVAKSINLGADLYISDGDEVLGVRTNVTTLEDACEALIGALYIDGGFEAARSFVCEHWGALLDVVQTPAKDAKTRLQELVQGNGLPLPAYVVLEREGLDHAPIFTIEVQVSGFESAIGIASSKRAAEQLAAENWLKNNKELQE